MSQVRIGVIGGSGLYQMDALADVEEVRLSTPFGDPSDSFIVGSIGGERVAFLPRHGRGHLLLPTEIPFRANIYAMKMLGVERIISASAVGSLREELKPMDIVFPDQFFDRTRQRVSTFFGGGIVAHVTFADPVCSDLCDTLQQAARAELKGIDTHRGGTYLCMEGPAFSTKAESEAYRSWGMSVIGMTNIQEAKLAREAEICYATVAMVTDYDCWHEVHGAVTVDKILQVLHDNADHARALVRRIVPLLADHDGFCPEGCQHALDNALITAVEARDPAILARLDAVAGRVLKG